MKLKADIYRYMTEFAIGADFTQYKEEADHHYKTAVLMLKYWRQKKMGVNPDDDKIDTLRLSLQLNYAIFMYDIKNEKKHGLRNLKKLIQEALDDFEKWEKAEVDMIKSQIELI